MFPFDSMATSSGQWSPTWGGFDRNMQLKACDSISVGNPEQGIYTGMLDYYLDWRITSMP